MRINLTLTKQETDAVNSAIKMTEVTGFPITATHAVRTFMQKGIQCLSEQGKLGQGWRNQAFGPIVFDKPTEEEANK